MSLIRFIKSTFFFEKNILEKKHSVQENSLSIVVVETIFFALILILGCNTLFILVAQSLNIQFKTYLTISPIISLLGLVCAGWIYSRKIKNVITRDYDVLIKLCILSLISATLIMLTPGNSLSNSDNYFYVPNVVYFLDHPNEPLDFQIHFLVDKPGKSIISPSQGTSLAFDYFRAVISYYTKTEYLASYFSSAVLMGLLVPLAFFLLICRFVNDPRRALVGTATSLAFLLISIDGQRTFGISAFLNASRSKFFVLSTGIPLFAAYSISFFQKPSKTAWLNLLLCTMALIGITTSATVLIGILAALLLCTFMITTWLNTGRAFSWKNAFLYTGLYSASLAYIFLYVLFLYILLKNGTTDGNYSALEWKPDFIGHLILFSNLSFPLTPILMILSVIIISIFLKGWQRQFLLIWTGLLLVFFLNPIGTELFIDRIVPSNIYWRLFYLFPFPLAVGVTIAGLPLSNKLRYILETGIILIGVLVYLLFVPEHNNLSFSSYKLKITNLETARQIASKTPAGIMLSPQELYGLIPMIDGFHPQIRTREDGDRLWLTRTEGITRERASQYVGGNLTFIKEFSQLLKENIVQRIVLNSTIFDSSLSKKTKTILRINGFIHQKKVGNYFIFWK